FFFFNDTAPTEIYTLSLHDALPISPRSAGSTARRRSGSRRAARPRDVIQVDRKSTRLNSSHANISYAVFCVEKTEIELLRTWRAEQVQPRAARRAAHRAR